MKTPAFAVVALFVLAWIIGPRSADAEAPAPYRLGQKLTIDGKEYFVEKITPEGKLLLAPPAEPAAKIGAMIQPQSVTASSAQRDAQHAINGSGFGETFPGSGIFVHTNNVYEGGASMWNSAGGDIRAKLTFDLGISCNLAGLYAWNYNEGGEWTAYGIKEFDLSVSQNGNDFTPVGSFELARAPGTPDDPGQAIAFQSPVAARYVRIDIKSNHGHHGHSGLAEIRFADADRKATSGAQKWTPTYPRPQHPKLKPGQPLPDGGENFTFPADAGLVDVTKHPYNAKGDGVTDDTAAIQRALDDHPNAGAMIYLPNGVYRISDTLRWPMGGPDAGDDAKNTILWGQSRAGTIIQLKDAAPGFENPRKSKALIWCGNAPAQRFGNEVHNITLDTGVDNPGASGAMFMANNQGGMYNCAIVSGDGQGVAGLNLAYTDEQGPLLIRNVKVTGFDLGIHTATSVASVTFEHITVEQQNVTGFRNDGQPASIRGLISRNAVPAVTHSGGLMTLIDSELTGTGEAAHKAAIVASSPIFARNVRTNGYALSMDDRQAKVQLDSAMIAEHRSQAPYQPLSGATKTLNLPIEETPDLPWDDHAQWASPRKFGAVGDGKTDDSAAFQKAIDSGATTVYIPRGAYAVGQTILIRGNVRRIIGARPWLVPAGPVRERSAPMFRFADGTHPVVSVERIATDFTVGPMFLEHDSKRTLLLRQVMINFQGGINYRNTGPATGPVFFEDVVAKAFEFNGQTAWARQLNPEAAGLKILNDGGTLWVLGLKCESRGSILEARNGARTEVLGGLSQTNGGSAGAMFINHATDMSLVFSEVNNSDDPYRQLVVEKDGAKTGSWDTPDAGFRGFRWVNYEGRAR